MNRGFDIFSINQINSHLVANDSILEIRFPLSLLTWIFFLSKICFSQCPLSLPSLCVLLPAGVHYSHSY